jgi:hypothetical protein
LTVPISHFDQHVMQNLTFIHFSNQANYGESNGTNRIPKWHYIEKEKLKKILDYKLSIIKYHGFDAQL